MDRRARCRDRRPTDQRRHLQRGPRPLRAHLSAARGRARAGAVRLARVRARARRLGGGRHLLDGRARGRQAPAVSVARRRRLPARLSMHVRGRAAARAPAGPFLDRRLARWRDRWSRRCSPGDRGARACPGRADEGRPGRGRDQPRLPARRRAAAVLSDRRLRGGRRPGRAQLAAGRPRSGGVGHRRSDLPLPGGDRELCRWLSGLPLARGGPRDRRRGAVGHAAGRKVRIALDAVPGRVRRDRRRGPRLGPLRAHRGGLGLARGSDARGRCRSAADQLPGEPKASGGRAPRRRHRRAHRAPQPPLTDRASAARHRARRPGRLRNFRPRRLQGIQRQLRSSSRRHPLAAPRSSARTGRRSAGRCVPPRR